MRFLKKVKEVYDQALLFVKEADPHLILAIFISCAILTLYLVLF